METLSQITKAVKGLKNQDSENEHINKRKKHFTCKFSKQHLIIISITIMLRTTIS